MSQRSARVPQVQIFIASPGDVADERAIAIELTKDLPYDRALYGRVFPFAVAWDPVTGPAMDAKLSAQEAVNRGLPKPSECDIVLVLFWARLGTPVRVEGKDYPSGSAYELLEALETDGDWPRVYIYRRRGTPSVPLDADDRVERESQLESLNRFLDDLTNPAGGPGIRGVNRYDGPGEFRLLVNEHLRAAVLDLLEERSDRLAAAVLRPDPRHRNYVAAPDESIWEGVPFPGLRALDTEDSALFFGRRDEIDALAKQIRDQRFTALVGASGSGKSSLIRAGVIPRLTNTGRWTHIVVTPDMWGTHNPFTGLGNQLAGLLPKRQKRHAEGLSSADGFKRAVEVIAAENPQDDILLVIDQFEELLTTVDERWVDPFIELLHAGRECERLRTVVTLRADFFSDCLDRPRLAELLRLNAFPLPAPDFDDLREMIVGPAFRARLTYEEGVIDDLLKDTGSEPGSLALMAYTLLELYRSKGEDSSVITRAAYRELGGVQGAIARQSEKVYQTLSAAAQNALPDVFRELVQVDNRGLATRRRGRLGDVARTEASKELVEVMTQARLLVGAKGDHDEPVVEIAHEALLRSWDRLRDWIREYQEDLVLLRQVESAARQWDRRDRDGVYLWPHERLQPVYEMQKRLRVRFKSPVDAFISPELDRRVEEWNSAKDARTQLNLVDRFREIGEPALPILEQAVTIGRSMPVRTAAIQALGDLGSTSSIALLTDEAVKKGKTATAAVKALGKIGDEGVVGHLHRSLSRLNLRVNDQKASATIAALEELGDPRSTLFIEKSLERAMATDRNSRNHYGGDALTVARKAAIVLGRIGDPSSEAVLRKAARYGARFKKPKSGSRTWGAGRRYASAERLRKSATVALGKLRKEP